jgi:hypothetical protein
MKGFIITAILFIALIVSIILNCEFVNTVHDDMHSIVAKLSNEPNLENEKTIKALKEYWDRNNTLLSVSVSFREIDNLSNAIDSLYAANKSQNTAHFLLYKELTQNAIDAIMRLEKFSIKNIF